MSPWQYTIFIVYKIKFCVIDWHVVFLCYNTSGWKKIKHSHLIQFELNYNLDNSMNFCADGGYILGSIS